MTMKLFNTSSVQNIADAIRARNGLSSTYKIAEMASAVSAIATDGTATADKILSGYTAYGLSGQKMVGTAQDSGGTAIVVTDEPDEHGGTIRYINGVSLDGDTVSAGTMFSGVTAHNSLGSSIVGTYVPPTLSTLIVTPTETAQAFPPAGATYAGYSQVTVNGISSNYVGTNVSRMSSSNLTFATGTGVFTAPSGYYSTNATYTLTPKTSENITFNYGNGEFKVSSGYYSSSPTLTLSVKAGTTITPTESEQIAVSSYYFVKGSIKVDGISSNYVGTNVSRMSSSNLTFTTGTGVFTAPKGYYSTNATYTLTPKTSANIAFNSGTGVFTVSSGYYSSNPTLTLSTRAGTTITPISTGSQIAVSSGYFATGSVYVGAIPNTYVQPTGTLNITSNGTFDVKNYASASVSIAGGEYYEIYRSLANHSTITNNITSISEYLGALSTIEQRQFEGQRFSGEFVFSNATRIGRYGFGNAFTGGFTPFNNNADFVFPICSVISSGAFAFYKAPFTITLSSTSAITIDGSAFLSASITSISAPYCSYIGDSAFYQCTSLTGIVAPRVSNVGQYAFYQCFNLSVADVSGAPVIWSYAFYQCSALTEIQLSVCTSIHACAFQFCSNLSIVSAPSCSYIWSSAFQSCISLQTIYAPNCVSLYTSAFYSCPMLSTIHLSRCLYLQSGVFRHCSSLTDVSLPECISIGTWAFANCAALESISFLKMSVGSGKLGSSTFLGCTSLKTVILSQSGTGQMYCGAYLFSGCFNLLSLYLLCSSMASFGTGMFYSTPISNYTTSTGGIYGSIYVPSSLYNTYVNNTSWKTYSARFVSLTDAQIQALLA